MRQLRLRRYDNVPRHAALIHEQQHGLFACAGYSLPEFLHIADGLVINFLDDDTVAETRGSGRACWIDGRHDDAPRSGWHVQLPRGLWRQRLDINAFERATLAFTGVRVFSFFREFAESERNVLCFSVAPNSQLDLSSR